MTNELHDTDRFKRSGERGAAVFVVMMAVLLLSSLGVWAMRSAALTNTATGYQRASAQALFAAELGIVAGTGYLAVPGIAASNYRYAEAALHDASLTPDDCESIPTSVSSVSDVFCKNIIMADVDDPILTATTHTTLDFANAQGSLSPYAAGDPAALQGDYVIELSEPRKIFVAGNDVADLASYKRFTLTSYGAVRPGGGALCSVATAGQNAAASRLAMRSHVVLGPLE